jgi:signal transduction histidine kinase
MTPLDMAKIVEKSWQNAAFLIQESQAEVTFPQKWPQAWGHAPLVEQVWLNYISNGIKYGGKPPLLQLGADPDFKGMVRFWVKDNGLGLTPEQQAHLFIPFTRLHQAKVDGHGLGLSISRRIIEKMGGQVGVESEPGQGSLFYFTLPKAG